MAEAVALSGLRFRWPGGGDFELSLPEWRVPAGGRACVAGPSGCGKSTLLGLIAGELEPTEGRVVVAGAELTGMRPAQRARWRIRSLGFVFQDFPLLPYLDLLENVLLPYRLSRALHLDAAARARAAALLGELGLGARGRDRPGALSQGERQRVAVARALVTEPILLLADEPTAGLDPGRAAAVLELLERSCTDRGMALVVVTHDPAVRARFEHTLLLGAG